MKVFLAWSGEVSRKIGTHLRKFLPLVLGPNVEIFMSEQDIQGGEPWFARIAQELATSHYAIICLTPENVSTPWLHWEAGAIATRMEKSRACPYLFGLEEIPKETPLAELQARQADKEGTMRLLQELNSMLRSRGERSYDDAILLARFQPDWEKLAAVFEGCNPPGGKPGPREMLDEMLQTLTDLASRLSKIQEGIVTLRNGKYTSREWVQAKGEAFELVNELTHRFADRDQDHITFHGPGGRFFEIYWGTRP